MKIECVGEPEFRVTFSRSDGWVIAAAIKDFAEHHPDAHNVKEWQKWADELDKKLRASC